MPRGRRTSYTRDNSGRFASSPGGGAPKRSTPATRRAATRAGNRLNRDNSGRISGIGRNGATVRGGRLKTAKGNKRATQLASMRPAGLRAGTIAKGGRGVRGMVARSLAAARQQPQRPSRKPANKAQRAYLAARSVARSRGGDLQGADARSRRMANSAAAVVKGMERRRSAAVPKAPADSPRARQQQRQAARAQRAIRNQRAAMAREADGPGSKASRSATVARRAQQIYAGKVDPRAKTKSRLTRTSNPEALRKRIAKIKDNTARAAAKAAAKAAKAAAKPAKAATPVRPATSNRPKRALVARVGRADRADNKLTAQLKQAKASGNLKKENEIIRRRQRIDRFNKTYNFADLKASRKALTPDKPTAPKRTRSARPAGTVAKPRGMKPGVLAARRGVKAKPSVPGFAPKDFERRASRAFYNTKNPKVKERALALYKQMMDTSMAPSQVKKLMTTGKGYSTVKNKPKPARQRLSKGEREHRDMLALAGKLFR